MNELRIAEESRNSRADVCPENIGQFGAAIMHIYPSTSAKKLVMKYLGKFICKS
jgi:hypothetical protein